MLDNMDEVVKAINDTRDDVENMFQRYRLCTAAQIEFSLACIYLDMAKIQVEKAQQLQRAAMAENNKPPEDNHNTRQQVIDELPESDFDYPN